MTGLLPREPRSVFPHHLDRDLSAGVPDSDDEYRPFLKLRGVPVLAGMELRDARIELVRERRRSGDLMACHRDHHVLSREEPVARFDDEMAAVPGQPIDSDAGSNRER